MLILWRIVRQSRLPDFTVGIIRPCKRSLFSAIEPKCGSSILSTSTCQGVSVIPTQLACKSHLSQFQSYSSDSLNGGIFTKLKNIMGIKEGLKYPAWRLRYSGLRAYLCCVELVDHKQFFDQFPLPDTFESWFRITALHIWMAMTRLSAESREGKLVRDSMIKHMWLDVEKRAKLLGGGSVSPIKTALQVFHEQLLASIYSYDEGFMGSDMDLAGAVWRSFFYMESQDAQHVELLVKYIRKQMHHLEQQDAGIILSTGLMTWYPLHGSEDKDRTRRILNSIVNRS